ncbi:hypothetical protein N566_23315 [Streptomycetaceae bacterium MP113-05]|nr:hypothetical protein N566_23315 [Streptomycetaceae bacterium MP113-05]
MSECRADGLRNRPRGHTDAADRIRSWRVQ